MSSASNPARCSTQIVLPILVLLGAAVAGGFQIDAPGLEYDEAFQAVQAKDFLSGAQEGEYRTTTRSIDIFGRPFPLSSMAYIGALKSYLLMPSFLMFGVGVDSLRWSTLVWGLLGLLFFMSWVRRVFGENTALVAGVLVALDPTFLFLSRNDWGPFAVAFLCRCGALWAFAVWHDTHRERFMFVACLFLGLGIYNKIDFISFVAGVGLAAGLFLLRPAWPSLLENRLHLRSALLGLFFGAIGTIPMISGLGGVTGLIAKRNFFQDLPEKLAALGALLDGSYFARAMLAGGFQSSIEALPDVQGGGLRACLFVAFLTLIAMSMRRNHQMRRHATLFVVGSMFFVAGFVFAMPLAIRVHHMAILYPFPHLVIALAASLLWTGMRRPSVQIACRVMSGGLVLTALVGNLATVASTHEIIARTGGRGRWSDSIYDFVRDIEGQRGITVMSMDWGFNQQLMLLSDGHVLYEPFWAVAAGKALRIRSSEKSVFLVHPPEYSLFQVDGAFMRLVAALPESEVTIEDYRDREDRLAFRAVRFVKPRDFVLRRPPT